MKTFPFAEVGGAGPEVDGDVPDVTGEDADELSLGFTELVVKAAEDAFGREGLVILDEMGREVLICEFHLVVNFRKPTATISESLGFH